MNYTEEQLTWIKNFESKSGFDVLYPEDGMSFEEVARFNIGWLESHHCEVFHAVSNYPRSDDDFFKEQNHVHKT